MDTNSNIPPQKKVVSVEILHLDELGYGPQGKHTRREWRKDCLENLRAGKDQFEAWQDSWKDQISKDLQAVSFASILVYSDGTQEPNISGNYVENVPYILDFVAHTFEESVNANGFTFEQTTYFHNAKFIGNANFQSARFKGVANFYNATFISNAFFFSAVFTGSAIFKGATFTWNGHFNSAMFGGIVYFSSATFTQSADFTSAEVTGAAYFSSTTFAGSGYFGYTTFIGDAAFDSATFKLGAYFSDAKFKEAACFSCATFTGDTYFCNTTFKREAEFCTTTFTEDADFNNATFTGDVEFCGATFTKDADFFKTKFINQCRFDFNPEWMAKTGLWERETWFMGAVNFENAVIENVGHFERARFKGEMPNFLGVDNAKTLLIFSGDEYFNKEDITEDSVKRLGQLKRLADEQGQTDQALMFNAFELNAKAKQPNAGAGFILFTRIYEEVSDFGRSFTNPLKIYIKLLLITLFLASAHAVYYTNKECKNEHATFLSYLWRDQIVCVVDITKPVHPAPLSGWRAAFEYTIYRSAGILDFSDNGKGTEAVAQRLFGQQIEPPWMRAWGVFKAIASTALLFLATLGLRNKYRIK